jgi:hypothetical protein
LNLLRLPITPHRQDHYFVFGPLVEYPEAAQPSPTKAKLQQDNSNSDFLEPQPRHLTGFLRSGMRRSREKTSPHR